MKRLPAWGLILAAGLTGLSPASAQKPREPGIEIVLPANVLAQGPVVRAYGMLSSARMRELLTAGFPARFHFQVELWSEGPWLNDVEGHAEYTVLVRYIAIEQMYEVVQIVDSRPFSLGKFARPEDAEGAVARPTRVPLPAFRTKRKLYYQTRLEVEVLSLSDLDEVDRWLRGELRPAISGNRNPGTALTRGLRTLVTRMLGGEKQAYDARTESFRTP